MNTTSTLQQGNPIRYAAVLVVVLSGCSPNIKQLWEDHHDLNDAGVNPESSDEYNSPKTAKSFDAVIARLELMEQRTIALLREIAAANPDELIQDREVGKAGTGEVGKFPYMEGNIGGKITVRKYLEDLDDYVSPYSEYLKDRKKGVITDKQILNGDFK